MAWNDLTWYQDLPCLGQAQPVPRGRAFLFHAASPIKQCLQHPQIMTTLGKISILHTWLIFFFYATGVLLFPRIFASLRTSPYSCNVKTERDPKNIGSQ